MSKAGSTRVRPCMFCGKELQESALADHLLICGNKTDECPRCRKFVRRAVFAYHYENACVDPDELENETSAASNQRSISEHIPAISSALQQSKVIIRCQFCRQQCEKVEQEMHENNCLRSPGNIRAKQQQSRIYPTTNSPPDHVDPSNQSTEIPCEFCRQLIQLEHYQLHTTECSQQYAEQQHNESSTDNRNVATVKMHCKYCGVEQHAYSLSFHEKICLKNPDKAAAETQYQNIFRLPSLQS
ncbi:unnamed protein product [Adineta ricciae]|uniref:Uncharacterized protein n=1 Tax=Adineta ricciae TaxID=249248 RepID=A0A814EFK3_ADIRI|nr:unnamed protein product [Adineta ricciae]